MNVLGGYQKINLSTADLTASTLSVEGLSKACANANGKAVLVKMPDGTEAFGAVKEVTGGFQLSAMGADSKVSQFNVDDTDDSFTMKTGVDTSNIGAEAYTLQQAKQLSTLEQDGEYAIIPDPGYIWMSYPASVESGSRTTLSSKNAAGTSPSLAYIYSAGADVITTVFVYPGMKVKTGTASGATAANVSYIALKRN